MGRLESKVALITGAASGIGRATARRLAMDGAAVVVADVKSGEAAQVAAEIVERGGRAAWCVADVSIELDIVRMVETAVEVFGRLDILHNNASMTDTASMGPDPIEEADPSSWLRMYELNVLGVVLGCKHAIPHMRRNGGGSIINTSSAAGIAASGKSPSYGATKAAINLVTKHVATTHGSVGIRCNAVAPGLVLTERVAAGLTKESIEQYVSKAALDHAAVPEEIASVIAFLASDDAKFVTGEVISVDGGLLCSLPYAHDFL